MKDKKDDLTFKELRALDNANSKDAKMNTPKKLNSDISIMPHDEETLKTFHLKEMNFKDMTNAQKNAFIVIILVVILFLVLLLTPSIRKLFGGVTIGNLRFKPTENTTETKDDSSYAYEGDLFVIGNNTSVVVGNIKFNNFTKGSNYSGLYSYTAQEDIKDVSSLKIYVEYYNYSKTLLRRFKFTVDKNELKKGETGNIQNVLSENAFNKAHYVTIRVMSDAEIIEVPDPENPTGKEETIDDGQTGENSNETKKNNKNELTCKKVSVDNDIRINEVFLIEFKNNELKKYSVHYMITKISYNSSSNSYSKYFKKMLNKYKKLASSNIKDISIYEELYKATLEYSVILEDYYSHGIQFEPSEASLKNNPNIIDEFYEDLEKDKDYKLEIDRKANKVTAKESLEKKGFVCE